MKKFKSIFYLALVVLGLSTAFTSCKKEDFDEPPHGCGEQPAFSANATIKEIKDLLNGEEFVKVTDDLVISGRVVSSDQEGNFYKTVFIYNESEKEGIEVRLDQVTLYNLFPQGAEVLVKTKDLYVGSYGGQKQLGSIFVENGTESFGRIPAVSIDKHVFKKGCAKTLTPPVLYSLASDDLKDYLNNYVTFDSVYFSDADTADTYADAVTPATKNRTLTNKNGQKLVVRTSGFAAFAGAKIPSGKGKISGVVTKFNDTYQLIINLVADVKLDTPFDRGNGSGGSGNITPNATIQDIKNLYKGGDMEAITQDLIIEGAVISSDEQGNFFKQLYIQDATGGIEIRLNAYDLYQTYPVGKKVAVKLKGLFLGSYGGVTQIGGEFNGAFGRLDEALIPNHLFVNGTASITPENITLDGLTDAKIGTLIQLSTVQFVTAELGETYADAVNKKTANRTITNCTGTTILLRSSGYASFAGETVAQNNGTITAVLTKFNADYQLTIRSLGDVQMSDQRCTVSGGGGGGGSWNTILTEDFQGITPGSGSNVVDISLTGWKNEATSGTDLWNGREYQSNKFANFSSHFSSDASTDNVVWLITPSMDLSAQTEAKLTFKSAKAFWNHNNLEVLISTDFDGTNISGATWNSLSATLAVDADNNYDWISSGDVSLDSYLNNNVYVAFRYTGNKDNSQSSTYRLDDIKVEAK